MDHSQRSHSWLLPTVMLALTALLLAACTTQAGTTGQPTAGAATIVAAPASTSPAGSATAAAQAATAAPAPQQTAGAAMPACTPGTEPTASLTEGPYYKANPPERTSLLEPGVDGPRLTVEGYVLGQNCQPIPGARVDFWQADAQGQYDNAGYRLRGYQLTDAAGRYVLETVVPGIYPGRTRHLHVKVQAPDRPALTTQLFFPDEPMNTSDRIFSDSLVVAITDTPAGRSAVFHFVLAPK